MRNMGMLISIALVVTVPTGVSAEEWKAHTVVEPAGSVQTCIPDPIPYTLDLANNTFTATSEFGKMFSITVPANGEIDKIYTRPGGRGTVFLRMTGNVKSRELEISLHSPVCRYKLVSDS